MALSELKNTSKNLPAEIESAINSQIEYYKLYSFRVLAKSATGLVNIFIMGLLALAVLFFLAVAGAFALGTLLQSTPLGFLAMALLLSILAIAVYWGRKRFVYKPILERLSEIYFNKD